MVVHGIHGTLLMCITWCLDSLYTV